MIIEPFLHVARIFIIFLLVGSVFVFVVPFHLSGVMLLCQRPGPSITFEDVSSYLAARLSIFAPHPPNGACLVAEQLANLALLRMVAADLDAMMCRR